MCETITLICVVLGDELDVNSEFLSRGSKRALLDILISIPVKQSDTTGAITSCRDMMVQTDLVATAFICSVMAELARGHE